MRPVTNRKCLSPAFKDSGANPVLMTAPQQESLRSEQQRIVARARRSTPED